MKNIKKSLVLLTAMVVLLCAVVGGTVAYLVTATDPVTNTFTPSSLETEIEEKFSNNVKSDVKITNTGNVKAYIRAAVIVTWQNTDGTVYGVVPKLGEDYSYTGAESGWTGPASDGYYYYTSPVEPRSETSVLIQSCKPQKAAPADGYTLHVEIISEAIQAEPTTAVHDAWGVTVGSDGKISIKGGAQQ